MQERRLGPDVDDAAHAGPPRGVDDVARALDVDALERRPGRPSRRGGRPRGRRRRRPAIPCRSAATSSRSPRTGSAPWARTAAAASPLRASAATVPPSATSRRTSAPPMKPEPPVTKACAAPAMLRSYAPTLEPRHALSDDQPTVPRSAFDQLARERDYHRTLRQSWYDQWRRDSEGRPAGGARPRRRARGAGPRARPARGLDDLPRGPGAAPAHRADRPGARDRPGPARRLVAGGPAASDRGVERGARPPPARPRPRAGRPSARRARRPRRSTTVDGAPGSGPPSSTRSASARIDPGTSSRVRGSGPPARLALDCSTGQRDVAQRRERGRPGRHPDAERGRVGAAGQREAVRRVRHHRRHRAGQQGAQRRLRARAELRQRGQGQAPARRTAPPRACPGGGP